ncbi:MAG: haloacid dehalogenase [Armatimonadetes bacterium]|nr:haloacid dehalogenase [Armatimonadota bacterium]
MSNEVPHCQSLEEIANSIRAQMESSNSAREEALKICREVIQLSSRTIRAIHREEMTNAQTLLAEAKNRVERAKSVLKEHPDLLHAGYVHDSQKEYVEAETMLAIVTGQPIPSPEVMGVEPAAYLNGLAEAASESRRHVLDRLRLDDIAQAERVLKRMDDIYYELVTFDFPDAITGGLRRTTDALRAVLERTRADLTLTLSQKRLQSSLQSALERLSGSDNRVD